MQEKKPRILHIITKLAVGGAQYNTLISTRDIAAQGYHSDILTGPEKPAEGDLFGLAEKWNLNIITAPHLKRNISPFSDFLALCEIKEIIRKGKYNIVHTHGSKARFLGRIAAAASKDVVVVQTAHGWPFYDSMNPLKEMLYVTLEKIGFDLAHINICVSPRDRDKGLGHGLGHFDDYRIVRSGVDFDEFCAARGSGSEARRKLGINPDAEVIGSVMRFCPEKAPDIYIKVAAQVIKSRPESIFILVGDGPLRKQAEDLIDLLQLRDNIILLGSRNDVADILPAFDVFLITSRTEGLPRALLESLAAGVPVVSTNVGGIHELIDGGRNGFLSDEGDIDSLAADVNRILDFPDMTRDMMAHVDEDIEPFSAKRMVSDLYSLYTRLISPSLNVVFLCDDEPFNIPRTIARIVRRRPFNTYTLVSLHGHGSLSKPVLNIRRYMNLYGCFGFFFQLFRFAALKISGSFLFPTRYSHSLRQTARREHTGYAALGRLNSKKSRDYLTSLDPDVFISVACPQILRKKTLKIPRLGAWNVHSAILPRNRGMLPTFWSLLNGDTPGVTLHKMVPELDAGEILIQRSIDCSIDDTALHQLLDRTKHLAAEVVSEGLDLLEEGGYTLHPNPSSEATMNTFPSKKDIQRFKWLGGKITGVRSERSKVAISFDVEEWFQTYAARKWYPNDKWDQISSRIDCVLDRILQILDDHKANATFFFLGWIVERHPELVLKIVNKGHEIGYHGYNHVELTSLTQEQFSSNLDRFLKLIDSLSIPAPVGFRAPSFSMKGDTSWAVDEIVARGFKYDSSVYPMFKLRYGIPEAPQNPFYLNGERSSIIELPLASKSIAGLKVPVAGGAYFRFYPGFIHRMLLRSVARTRRTPVLYFHPWEIDSINISGRMNLFQRIRQHHNSGQNTISKLRKILKYYRGITLRELAEEMKETDLPGFSL
ncbi:MAG: glycosyltransferase [Candidatus Aegiribacteria sp.]|nr:glycosyltransferase [Candidatus Aegiribacteria sp.]